MPRKPHKAAEAAAERAARPTTQADYLRQVKDELGVDWDTLAQRVGVTSRTLKAYRLPDDSPWRRNISGSVRLLLERLRAERR